MSVFVENHPSILYHIIPSRNALLLRPSIRPVTRQVNHIPNSYPKYRSPISSSPSIPRTNTSASNLLNLPRVPTFLPDTAANANQESDDDAGGQESDDDECLALCGALVGDENVGAVGAAEVADKAFHGEVCLYG